VPSLTEENDAQGVVQLSVGRNYPFDGHMAHAGRDWGGKAIDLFPHIGRGIEEKPAFTIHTDRSGGLATP
jgi:hypothetical protein